MPTAPRPPLLTQQAAQCCAARPSPDPLTPALQAGTAAITVAHAITAILPVTPAAAVTTVPPVAVTVIPVLRAPLMAALTPHRAHVAMTVVPVQISAKAVIHAVTPVAIRAIPVTPAMHVLTVMPAQQVLVLAVLTRR